MAARTACFTTSAIRSLLAGRVTLGVGRVALDVDAALDLDRFDLQLVLALLGLLHHRHLLLLRLGLRLHLLRQLLKVGTTSSTGSSIAVAVSRSRRGSAR